MKRVGSITRAELDGGALVRLHYPPYDVVVAMVDGIPRAIEDACNHGGASLAEGDRTGKHAECVSCPLHGYVFDLRDGALLRPRGLCNDQRTFVARDEGDAIVVYDPVQITIL